MQKLKRRTHLGTTRHKRTAKKSLNTKGSVDLPFLIVIFVLLLFGLFMVYESSVIYSDLNFGQKYHFLLQQIGWVFIGLTGMYILSKINLDIIKKYSPYMFIGTLFLLLFILIPTPFAPTVYGARRWFVLNPAGILPALPFVGRISFQPSELAKLVTIVFLATYFTSEKIFVKYKEHNVLRILTVSLIVIVGGLVMLEPDYTTAMIIIIIIAGMYFFANGALKDFFIGIPVLFSLALLYGLSSEYRRLRLITLIKPNSVDTQSAGYHIRQIMIALGSGGFFGLGAGRSKQKYAYLPEASTDSIFAIIGEEFGFIGTILLISLFVFLVIRGIKIAQTSKDRFSALLVIGVMIWMSVHIFINLSAMVRLFPITGLPLPLISYGGSSMIFMLWGLGLVLNVSRSNKEI